MMRMVVATAFVCLAFTGCQRESSQRSHYAEDGFSIRALPDWTASRAKGTVVLEGPASQGLERTTIAIRPVAYTSKQGRRTHAGVVAATEKVLSLLPEASVRRLKADRGDAFEVRYRVPKKRAYYLRRHVVVGAGQRAFHVMLTAPSPGLDEKALRVFAEVVDSLREEV